MSSGIKVKCRSCGDIIQSTHVHDFVVCGCFKNATDNQGIAIDGGSEYTRCLGNPGNFLYEDTNGDWIHAPTQKEKPVEKDPKNILTHLVKAELDIEIEGVIENIISTSMTIPGSLTELPEREIEHDEIVVLYNYIIKGISEKLKETSGATLDI